ncbi:MAG: phosphoglucosamine mutase [Phycisphaerae bacterium]|nr:phosphoglucosamine mutase [Phycisphaerae bacterium]
MALMISVSGVRGLVGETLTPAVVLQFAQAHGTLLDGGRVAVARDSRPSGEMFAAAAMAGLIATGCSVTDIGIAMTPTLGRAIRDGEFKGGLMITASHNPGQWNGLKFLDHHGLAPDAEQVRRIREIRDGGGAMHLKDGFQPIHVDDGAGQRHAKAVLDAIEVDLAPLRDIRVVLDSINGAGCTHTPEFLAALGCDVVHVNGTPNGEFAHPPEPIAENVTDTCSAVCDTQAAVGFVQDPDADRLAIIDEHGRFIGEEYTLALAVESVLSRRKGVVATNLSTSRMIDDVAARHGVRVVRSPVGEAHVARALMAENGVIGGEGNGGVIDLRISPVRDSLSAMSQVLQLMAATGKTISELVAGLPAYAGIKEKITCPPQRAEAAIEAVARAFAGEKLNRSDGVRVDFAEGWVHLRASNTEPIVRIISEAKDADTARSLITRISEVARL